MPPIPAGFGEFTLHWQVDGDPEEIVAVCGFEDDNTSTPDEIATEIWDAWTGNFVAGSLTNQGHFNGVRLVANRAGVMVEGSDRRVQDGTAISGAMSMAVTGILTKHTGLAGQKYRGRLFLANVYLGEEDVDAAGSILPATVAGLGLQWTAFIAELAANDTSMQILHSDGVTAPTPVLSGHLEPYVATQRRRQRH